MDNNYSDVDIIYTYLSCFPIFQTMSTQMYLLYLLYLLGEPRQCRHRYNVYWIINMTMWTAIQWVNILKLFSSCAWKNMVSRLVNLGGQVKYWSGVFRFRVNTSRVYFDFAGFRSTQWVNDDIFFLILPCGRNRSR